jgi:predicted metalloendopeptidase
MDAPTRAKAQEKLKAMAYHIGYPTKWKAYEWPVTGSYLENALASNAYELKRSLDEIGKPVDREKWEMTPPTVNAYYNPQKNEMVFPAGILQPPFYSPKAAAAVNMGGMGMVVGHELTHGFDDEGSQFAADGNLQTWWAPETRKSYDVKTACLVAQYSGYEPLPGLKLKGELTLGENIADNGGVKLAFRAYQALRKGATDRVVADGFSEDQQFFLAVGQTWCSKQKEEVARMLATVDPHSPPKFRVNGALSNTPEFWEAFQCKAGTAMHPANACTVW